MPSPFPGMNPYLEQEEVWRDFHQRFVTAAAALLSPQISPQYIAKLEENIYIHERGAQERHLLGYADVRVSQLDATTGGAAATLTATAPAHFFLPRVDLVTEPFIEIRDRHSRALITVVELLSPTNKRSGEDREQYLRKRHLLLRSQAHFVEIDLLRGWQRMPLVNAPCDYCVVLSRVDQRPRVDWWPIRLREPLPVIPIPMATGGADANLAIQQALHRAYDEAFYQDYIYQESPYPNLGTEDAKWAQQFVPVAVPPK